MSNKFYKLFLNSIEVWLLPERALYIPQHACLVVADWHLGKTTHFRKKGVFLPKTSLHKEMEKLNVLINEYDTKKVVFLGDLFHSEWNTDWELFKEELMKHSSVKFILTKGNHDIIDYQTHYIPNLKVVSEVWIEDKIVLSHEVRADNGSDVVNMVGHTHPGVLIKTKQKHFFRLPCFYFDTSIFILPAFGDLTGLYIMEAKKENQVFVVLGDEVRKLKSK